MQEFARISKVICPFVGHYEDLWRALDYDINAEKNFSYQGLTGDEIIVHITKFVSGLWQIHPFGEGNTRTTAVFVIQYLRSIGFNVNNDFANRERIGIVSRIE